MDPILSSSTKSGQTDQEVPVSEVTGSGDLAQRSIDTVRTLSMDAVQAAGCGHPGTPMGLAPLAYALWTGVMRYDSGAPGWQDRDRFILSCGHASMLQYAMLHLTGYPLSLEDLRAFRQWGSPAAGHPEYGEVEGVETTTGPLGQGVGNGVGMALAERMLAARFNREGHEIIDHRTWVIASDGDLMEGVALEAMSLAGHLGLDRLCVFWDDNRITIDGGTDLSFSEDVAARAAACGWHILRVDVSEGPDAYVRAADAARAETGRPTLVVCRTHIGHGSPNKQDTSAAHGAALGEDEVAATKRAIGWPDDAHFLVPEDVAAHLAEAGGRGRASREDWEARWSAYQTAHPEAAATLEAAWAGQLPEGWEASLPVFEAGASMATRKASGKVLAGLAEPLPALVGGSADLAGSNNTTIPGSRDLHAADYAGRTIHFGVREHAMGAVCNGLALHGGLRPYAGTFFVFSDYMRASIRLAALMSLPVVYVFTHDSIGVGEDGPTHQPIEHLAALRAMPGLAVIRPADAGETVEAWRAALLRKGPTALVLTRQSLPVLDRNRLAPASGLREGGYVLHPGGVDPDAVLLATGSEVSLALEAAERLQGEGVVCRVVSLPRWDLLDDTRMDALCGSSSVDGGMPLRVGIEAGASFGWHRWVGRDGILITLDRFGTSAPAPELMRQFGFVADHVVDQVRRALAAREQG